MRWFITLTLSVILIVLLPLAAQGAGPRHHHPWSVHWNKIAKCESGKRWHINTGNGYYGGLQFSDPTWDAYRHGQFARRADHARKHNQKVVAERVLFGQGIGAWPVCGARG